MPILFPCRPLWSGAAQRGHGDGRWAAERAAQTMAGVGHRSAPDALRVLRHLAGARGLLGVDEGVLPRARDIQAAQPDRSQQQRGHPARRTHPDRGQRRGAAAVGHESGRDAGRPGHLRRLVRAPARHRGAVGRQLPGADPHRPSQRPHPRGGPDTDVRIARRDHPARHRTRGRGPGFGLIPGELHHVPSGGRRAILQRTSQPGPRGHRGAGSSGEPGCVCVRRPCRRDTSPEGGPGS